MRIDNILLLTDASFKEVPENFDLDGYINMRARWERENFQKLKEKYGDEIPFEWFNRDLAFMTIEVIVNMKQERPEAFDVLVAKLQNPQVEISEECLMQIRAYGLFLNGDEMNVLLLRSIFREIEKLTGSFVQFIEEARFNRYEGKKS
jgi:hypothetical protein